jgi:hypothetical protein
MAYPKTKEAVMLHDDLYNLAINIEALGDVQEGVQLKLAFKGLVCMAWAAYEDYLTETKGRESKLGKNVG